jgi:S-DNA-T family DNA segregation ATPase FtsK/SpoIIIE
VTTRLVHRPARVARSVVTPEPFALAAPPVLPDSKTGGSAMQSMLPMVGAMSSMTMMITMRRSPIMVVVGALIMVVALVAGLSMAFGQRAKGNRQRRLHRERYLDYLETLSEQFLADEEVARDTARIVDPDPVSLVGVIGDRARLWDRRRADADFLRVRIGTGSITWRELTVPDNGTPTQPSDEFMVAEAQALAARYRSTPGLPLFAPLDRAGDVAIVGPRPALFAAVRAIVAQAAVFHAPDDLAMALACDPERSAQWEWLTWLPHLIDENLRDGPVGARRVAADLPALAGLLSGDLGARAHFAAEARRGMAGDTALLAQRLLIVSDAGDGVAGRLPLPDATLTPAAAAITVVHLVGDRLHEPPDVSIRITVDEQGLARVEDLTDPDHPVVTEGAIDDAPSGLLTGIARALAPLRLSRSTLAEQAQIGSVDTATLLGVEDVTELDLTQMWQPRTDHDFLRVPIGVDDTGTELLLDFKESAQLGMGPHGLCVGATGSGKSELLRTLVATLATTHPPDQVAMVLVDYKGGAAFAPFAGIPHVAGIIDNLADEPGLIERVHASLNGEVVRRQRVLKDAGNMANIGQYNALRETHPDLEPLPHLLIVIDEFGELIAAEDEFIELFLTIGRIGRSIGVHLLLSSQRIESGRLKGLDTYLSYRLGLRTFSEGESQIVLDTPDAFHLPSLPGYGFLKVDTSVYTRFRAAYVSGAAARTVSVDPASDGTGYDDAERRVLRLPMFPGILAANGAHADERPTASLPERRVTTTLLDALLARILDAPCEPTRTIWLPPLPDAMTLDQAAGAAATVASRGLTLALTPPPMRAPIGLLDDPARQRQEPWLLDLTEAGGHAAVIGGPQSGKTTWLRSVVAGLALTHTPQQVAIYGVDLTGGGLTPLREFPHVGGVATRTDRERLGRTFDELIGMLAHREEVFRDRGIDSMDQLRRMHAAGDVPELPTADIVLVIDGAGAIRTDFDELDERFGDLLGRGPSYGLHLVMSLLRWNDLRIALQPAVGNRVELRLNDPGDSVISRKLSTTLAKSPPGRALTDGELFAQTALARVDGVADAGSGTQALIDLGRAVSAKWSGRRAPAVRVLPATVEASSLPDPVDEPSGVPIGLAESTLSPVVLDLFGRDPHLLVLGDSESGKTTLLRGIAHGLAERYTSDELVLAMYDPRRGLTGLVDKDYVGGYAGSSQLGERLTAAICQELAGRMPENVTDPDALAAGPSWEGPQIVLLVDDYDVLTAADQSPLAGFVPYLPSARDIGLHVVLARPVAGASRAMWEPVVSLLRDTGATGLLLSGDRSEGQLFPGCYAQNAPAGRGFFLRRGAPRQVVQLAAFDSSAPAAVPARSGGGAPSLLGDVEPFAEVEHRQ